MGGIYFAGLLIFDGLMDIIRIMKIEPAKISDVESIYSLVNYYAQRDKMLFCSKAYIYENLQSFTVVRTEKGVIGCCSLRIVWSDLAEIKSLAVEVSQKGGGAGKKLVGFAVNSAKQMEIPKVFALTLEPDFFKKAGFEIIEKTDLPMKVWSDCAKCPKQQNCDEVALIKKI